MSHALLTHWHEDHVGGVKDLLSLCKNVSIHKHHPCDPNQSDNIEDGQTFRVEGATLRALHCPGHTADHMAFILEEENNAMFTGDNVLGHGTAVFDDLVTYLRSLELMSRSFSGRAYPGHGAVVSNGPEKVREYIVHRHRREEEIVRVLLRCDDMGKSLDDGGAAITTTAAAATEEALTARELVEIIYKDVSRNLHDAAENGVLQVLRKLLHEGKVVEKGDGKWEIIKLAAKAGL